MNDAQLASIRDRQRARHNYCATWTDTGMLSRAAADVDDLLSEVKRLRTLLCAPPTEQETEPAARLICGLCNTDPRVQIPEDAWTAYTINARDVLVAAFAVRAEQVQP